MILLTHTDEARDLYYGPRALAGLQALGPVRLNNSGHPLAGPALAEAASGASVIVADRAVPAPAELFAALPGLLAFVRCAVDVRTVDIAAASAAGILVTHASPGFAASVTELILGVTIDLHRGISRAGRDYASGRRPPVRMGREIRGSVVGIIGLGTIGRALVAPFIALGATVVATDPAPPSVDGVTFLPLEALLEKSDTVVCLAPATADTAGLLGAEAIARMKPGAFLVNASRGELVDEAALTEALDAGRLAGAALDVGMAPDQMPSPALARRADVVATPHIGGLTRPAAEHQALETVDQVRTILDRKVPDGALNAAYAFRLRRA